MRELKELYKRFVSEVVAHQSEALFGNEQMLTKLAKGNKTLLQKLIDRIKQFIDVIRAKTPEERSLTKKLQQAQRLFEKALDNAGVEYIKSTSNTSENVDRESQVQYNNSNEIRFSTKTAKYISYSKIGEDNIRAIRRQLSKLYEGLNDVIADGIAIGNGNDVYIIDSGKENKEIRFGIRKIISISNDDLRLEYIRRTNNESISKGHISDELSSRFGNEHDNDRGRDMRREFGEELSADTRESTNNERRVSNEDANRGGLKYSLKDTQKEALESRGVKGDAYLDCEDLANEILAVGGEITNDAKAVLYHATSVENAKKIIESGKMYGKEDNLFFSTRSDGEIKGYGNAIVRAEIPLEKLQLNDVFDKEVHLTMSVRPNTLTNIRFSLKEKQSQSKKISIGMTDDERYEILKNRVIYNIPNIESNNSITIPDWQDINKYFGKEKRNLIQKIAYEFGVLDKEYRNTDVELNFKFSNNNFRESYNKQGRNYVAFAKMFSVFDEIINRAIGIETHNRNDYKQDVTLDKVFVLVSAYQEGENIVPVKLEVKKFKDKTSSLYVAISLSAIKKTEVWKQGTTDNGVAQNSRSVNISIADLFKNINPSDKSFYKYIPKNFLNDSVKFSLKETSSSNKTQYRDIIARASKLEKYIADNTKLKKYSRQDAKDVISSVMTNEKYFDGYDVTLRGKSRAQIERILWNGLNGRDPGERASVALEAGKVPLSGAFSL